ncbi:MAG: hypothetical protein KAI38_07565, partial [Candidatus Latescibacteria bacterium]|nr:hypothetical protein [Candidatus Latescibacterota bacterium]
MEQKGVAFVFRFGYIPNNNEKQRVRTCPLGIPKEADMNSLVVAAISFFAFILAYRFYGTFISQRLFGIDPGRKTPAHTFEDGVDFVPTRRSILF